MAELLRQGGQTKDSNFNVASTGLYLPGQNQQMVNSSFSGIPLSPTTASVLSGFNNIQSAHLGQQQVFNSAQSYDDVLLGSKSAGSLSSFAHQFAAGIPDQLGAYNGATQSPPQFGQLSALNSGSLSLLAQQRALAAAASSIGGSGGQLKGPESN